MNKTKIRYNVGTSNPMYGKKHKTLTIEKMRGGHRGMLGKRHSEETKKKIGVKSKGRRPMLGKKHSEQTKRLMSVNCQREKNPNWKGGITEGVRLFRKSRKYQQWRRTILKKYNFVCQSCGKIDSKFIHHVQSVKRYPELRFDTDNGLCLCSPCHNLIHRRGDEN